MAIAFKIKSMYCTEGGVRVCGIGVLGYFWCGVAVIFISKYGIAVFRVQAVCVKFKISCRGSRWKNRCVVVICFFFMTCAGIFTAEPLRSLRRTDEPPKGRNSCLRLRPRSVFSSFGVVLMSCKVNFHVVRSALQNSVCLSIILMLGIMTQKIQKQIKRKIFYLLVNYKQSYPYLHSGNTSIQGTFALVPRVSPE